MYRMDLNFNEQNLNQQLIVGKCSIITDKPISKHLLAHFRKNITDVVYLIKEEDDPEFCLLVKRLGLNLCLVSALDDAQISKKKINYMEVGRIIKKENPNPKSIKELKGLDLNSLFYRSNKYTLSNGKIYPSEASYKEDKPLQDKTQIFPVINKELFWESLDNYHIFKKVS